jgi:hypothetical protein
MARVGIDDAQSERDTLRAGCNIGEGNEGVAEETLVRRIRHVEAPGFCAGDHFREAAHVAGGGQGEGEFHWMYRSIVNQ